MTITQDKNKGKSKGIFCCLERKVLGRLFKFSLLLVFFFPFYHLATLMYMNWVDWTLKGLRVVSYLLIILK